MLGLAQEDHSGESIFGTGGYTKEAGVQFGGKAEYRRAESCPVEHHFRHGLLLQMRTLWSVQSVERIPVRIAALLYPTSSLEPTHADGSIWTHMLGAPHVS